MLEFAPSIFEHAHHKSICDINPGDWQVDSLELFCTSLLCKKLNRPP